MRLWDPETVTVQRRTQTSDGAGGWNDGAATVVYTGQAEVFVPRHVAEHRDEAEPGINTRRIRGFVFVPVAGVLPAIKVQDLIKRANGEIYTVMFSYDYGDNLQLEGWVMSA